MAGSALARRARRLPAVAGILLLAGTASPGGAAGIAAEAPADWAAAGAPRRFVGQDLYGHIDGGAELFHEFGFRDLTVQDYARGEATLTVETYRMTAPEAALGIYLAKCGRETPRPGLAARHTASRWQVTALRGDVFLLVNNPAGDEALLPDMLRLASAALADVSADAPAPLLDRLPAAGRVPGSERLLRGPIALAPLFTLGPGDVLGLGGETYAVAARYGEGAEGHLRIVVPYGDRRRAAHAFRGLRRGLDPFLEMVAARRRAFVFRDYHGRFGRAALDGDTLTILADLAAQPDLD
ncbi:MAG: hypothetical protein JW819_06885 [Candidatus Krumholzibacteriota bacterium]|nr:hypothetical protein [Candidatus Krumholzibacteriota bacterium]